MDPQQPSSIAKLSGGVLHLWRLSLSQSPEQLAELSRVLRADETERAASFRFEVHQQRFVAGRGQLRQVLASYLRCAAGDVDFRYSQHGKPLLAGVPSDLPIEFNLAHSEDAALVAVTLENRIGVDLERIRPLDDLAGVARSAFSARECRELFSLESSEQQEAFFHVWTCKEAVLKALGTGFSLPSRSFDVSVFSGDGPRLITAPASAHPAASWKVLDVPVGSGFAAALAIERADVILVQADWPGQLTGPN